MALKFVDYMKDTDLSTSLPARILFINPQENSAPR